MCVGVEVVVGVVVVVVVVVVTAAAAAAVSRVKDWLTHVAYHASSCDSVFYHASPSVTDWPTCIAYQRRLCCLALGGPNTPNT